MAQNDILLTQNTSPSGVEFSEKYVNIAKGGILTANGSGVPTVLTVGANTYQLIADDSEPTGLKWVPVSGGHTQNTDTGTTATTFQLDNDASGGKLKAESTTKVGIRNAADSAYIDLQAKDATFEKVTVTAAPTSGSDLANKDYVDGLLSANDAMIFKGTLGTGGTITSLPTTHSAGWTYRVIEAGTYAGVVCEVGDMITALVDRTGTGNSDSDWSVFQTNVDGAVVGPAGAVSDESIAVFNSNNRQIKSGAVLLSALIQKSGDLVNNSLTVGAGAGAVKDLPLAANSVVVSISANTPAALAVGASQIVGRKASGDVSSLTAAEVRTIINVADGANNYTHPSDGGGDLSTPLTGATVVSAIHINTAGHVTNTATRSLTAADIGAMLTWVSAPANKTSTGTAGQMAYDTNYLYTCTATNTWKRSALATNW